MPGKLIVGMRHKMIKLISQGNFNQALIMKCLSALSTKIIEILVIIKL